MKIRQGFVSNSSSSSFCIIGVSDDEYVKRLIDAERKNFIASKERTKVRSCDHIVGNQDSYCRVCGKPVYTYEEKVSYQPDELSMGVGTGKVVNFYGNYEPYYAGIKAEQLLDKMNLPNAKKFFVNLIKEKFGFNIPLDQVRFIFGEVGQ